MHCQIIKSVRQAVGNDYPIALRLGACDYMPHGSTIDDAIAAVKLFKHAGIDLIDISGGFCGYRNPFNSQPGYFGDASEAIKRHMDLPVLLTGGITTINDAQWCLDHDKADLIGVGRAILNDSDWAKKAMESLK